MRREFADPEQDGLFLNPIYVRGKDKLVQLFVVTEWAKIQLSSPSILERICARERCEDQSLPCFSSVEYKVFAAP